MVVVTGHPDIGGSRASMVNIVAGAAGHRLPPGAGADRRHELDRASAALTGGSRVTFAAALVVTKATEQVIQTLRERAAKIWKIDVEAVIWENGDGASRRHQRRRLPAADAGGARRQGQRHRRPDRRGAPRSTPKAQAGGFGTHICDVEVDPRDRQGPGHPLHGDPGRRPGHPSELRGGPDAGRRRPGHRLGAQRGVHLRRQGAAG